MNTTTRNVLAKVFARLEYAKSFLDGTMYFRSLSYFRNLEKEGADERGDKYEGYYIIRDNSVALQQDPEMRKRFPQGIEPLYTIRSAANANVFCTSIVEHTVDKGSFRASREIRKFGEFVVVILNVNEFLKRVRVACETCNCNYIGDGCVEYFDPSQLNLDSHDDHDIFRKRDSYSNEREYRFAIRSDQDCLILEIGDIRDIAKCFQLESV